ncbi:MAG: hypothetical protein NTZ48_03070 [Candidatus Omnitrophica bacterium]|nr:hypothetical protein [Candidatus Omnitrophota bacterium]
MKVNSVNDAINIVQKISGQESIFHSLDRIALPDEVFLFNTASHREKALALYTLIQHSINQDRSQKCSIVFTEDRSFILYGDKIIDAGNGEMVDVIPLDIILKFSEYGKEI